MISSLSLKCLDYCEQEEYLALDENQVIYPRELWVRRHTLDVYASALLFICVGVLELLF